MNPQFLAALNDQIGITNILTDPGSCLVYGMDNSRHHAKAGVVVFGQDTLQIQRLIQLCNTHGVPIYPRGRGTGTTGGAIPLQQGVVLSLERMQKIIGYDPKNRMLSVEVGQTNQQVQTTA